MQPSQKLQQLQSQQMELTGNPGKRPITLSPTYRYKKDENGQRVEVQQQLVTSGVQSGEITAKVETHNSTNDSVIMPPTGGKTPTSIISQQNGNDIPLGNSPQIASDKLTHQSTLKSNQNPSGSLQPTGLQGTLNIQNQNLMNQNPNAQFTQYNNNTYKVPTKLINSVASGLSNVKNHTVIQKGHDSHSLNLKSSNTKGKMQLKTQQLSSQFINSRTSHPHNSHTNVMNHGANPAQTSNSEVLPNINAKQYGKSNLEGSTDLQPRTTNDLTAVKNIPSIFDSQQNKLVGNRSISEFHHKTGSENTTTNQMVLNPKNGVYTIGGKEMPNKTFFIKNKTSSRNQSNGMYIHNNEEPSVEQNYGLTHRSNILNRSQHPPAHLRSSGESQLIQVGKMATSNMRALPPQNTEESSEIPVDRMIRTTPIMTKQAGFMAATSEQQQQQMSQHQKYLFNKTAACSSQMQQFVDPYQAPNLENKPAQAQQIQEKSDYAGQNQRQYSLSDKINYLNQKLNQSHNEKQIADQKAFLNENNIFQTATGGFDPQSLKGMRQENFKNYYTTFTGPIAVTNRYAHNIQNIQGIKDQPNSQMQSRVETVQSANLTPHLKPGPDALNENQLKIRKFLNLVDLQDLVEKETQYRINQSQSIEGQNAPKQTDSSKSNNRQASFNTKLVGGKIIPQPQTNQKNVNIQQQQNHQIDPNIWKHFQNLLQFDQNNSELSQKLTFSQKKTLLSLRAQLLKNSSLGLNSDEICKTIKQFIENCNIDELYKAPVVAGRRQRSKQIIQSSTSPTTATGFHPNSQPTAQVQQENLYVNNNSAERTNFNKNTNQVIGKEGQHQTQRQGSQQNQAAQKVININKLNINIQQYQNPQALQTMQSGVTGVSYAQANHQNYLQSRNGTKFQTTSSFTQKAAGGHIPKHVQDTLFIMDCQLFGLLKHIHLLNLDQGKAMPLSLEKDTKLSEAELVHFIMSRANSATSLMFKELPKLSEEAKQIINMIKAQQQVELQDEITRIETLVIEIDYVDYKNKLLQALFNNYGDSVLETIIHKIQPAPSEQETVKNLNLQHFQTINEYVNSIRKLHHNIQKSEFQNEMNKQGIGQPSSSSQHQRDSTVYSSDQFFEPEEFQQSNSTDEMSENLSYLFPNIFDPGLKSLNFTPGFRGRKYKDKKINFGVVVKETKLYHALRFADQLSSDNNIKNISGEKSKKCLSSYLVTNDCTLLRFMLFCSHAGIIRSAQASLRLFFKNVFIVIKPGYQLNSSSGQIVFNSQLPQVDVDKVTNYIQNQLKKKQKAMESYNHLKRLGDPSSKEKILNMTPNSNLTNTGSKIKGIHQNTSSSIDRNKSSVSLTSSKSTKVLEQPKYDVTSHFNSLLSSIRADQVPSQPTTIKIYHQPYTHLDQSRFQKIFRIYNEFVSLTFKNKLIYAQTGESMTQDVSDFSQNQATRICKLATQMGIKDLPKKHSMLRSPLLELFRNHRQLTKIKEQILRFLFKMLNEENDISHNFNQIVLAGYPFNLDKNQNVVLKDNDTTFSMKQDIDSKNIGGPGTSQAKRDKDQTVSTQKSSIYKYQVGYGNNHFLIKSIMKNRRWWICATSKDYVSNFDDAQIIWTQWCRNKLCNHLSKTVPFKFEYKLMIEKIDAKNPKQTNNKNLNNSDQKQAMNDKCTKYLQGSISPLKTDGVNSQPQNAKDIRQTIKQTSRQQKKQSGVQISTQYKSIENQQNSPEKPSTQNTANTEESKQVSPFLKSTKKKVVTRVKTTNEDDGSDDECNTDINKGESKGDQTTVNLNKMLKQLKIMKDRFQKVYNRLEYNQHLNNKKALFINMRNFYNYCCENQDVFNTLPLTFHIKDGSSDAQFLNFTKYYNELKITCNKNSERKNVWVIKPGENSNRGIGIKVESEFNRIKGYVDQYCSKYGSQGKKTVILQKYIDNPLLYFRRKFDVRCFCLVTCHNGVMKSYFYRDGYIRTASREFSFTNLQNKYVHLVNDAIQQNSEEYGRFETANKLSYHEFQKYLNQQYQGMNINFERDIIMQIRKIVTDSIRATFHLLDSKKRLNSYELFGYDFMFDSNFKPYLIEVNSNPCLEFSSSLLAKIFTAMLDNTFRIAVDPIFPPQTEGFASKKSAEGIDLCPENRFDMIFDERTDGPILLERFKKINLEDVNEVKALDELEDDEEEQDESAEEAGGINLKSQRSNNETPLHVTEEQKDLATESVEVTSKEE